MIFKNLFKFLPYIIIAILGIVLCFGVKYYGDKIEKLSKENIVLETQNAEINNNYNTLQSMYQISMKQNEELLKQQKESLEYVNELKIKLIDIDLKTEYNKNPEELLKSINEYEKCMAKNFNNPYYKCYGDKK